MPPKQSPPSATAAEVYDRLPAAWHEPRVIVATAHPVKFDEVVEPLIGRTIPVPPKLERLLNLPKRGVNLPPRLDALLAHLA